MALCLASVSSILSSLFEQQNPTEQKVFNEYMRFEQLSTIGCKQAKPCVSLSMKNLRSVTVEHALAYPYLQAQISISVRESHVILYLISFSACHYYVLAIS